MLRSTNNLSYLHVVIGDHQSEEIVQRFNQENNKNVKFIDVKTSEWQMAKGQPRSKEWILETNDTDEMMTYLFNLPENRYYKAKQHTG